MTQNRRMIIIKAKLKIGDKKSKNFKKPQMKVAKVRMINNIQIDQLKTNKATEIKIKKKREIKMNKKN